MNLFFFCPKMAVLWRTSTFPPPNKKGLKPLFLLCFGGERFLGQGVKKGKFWKATQKKKKVDW